MLLRMLGKCARGRGLRHPRPLCTRGAGRGRSRSPRWGVRQGLRRRSASAGPGIGSIQKVIGGSASDELIGSPASEVFNGGPGNAPDVMCGGLGIDTVDYSDKTAGVRRGPGRARCPQTCVTSSPRRTSRRAPTAGRSTTTSPLGTPVPGIYPTDGVQRDCTPDDGTLGEGDCVGEDTENIVGSPHNDVLIGNDPDPLSIKRPRSSLSASTDSRGETETTYSMAAGGRMSSKEEGARTPSPTRTARSR